VIDELNTAIGEYWTKWRSLLAARQDKAFFEALKPTAVGWKVADRAEYDRLCKELHDQSSHVLETWMNGRWIAKCVLRDTELSGHIKIVKVMQRRPGSSDAAGLDHLDFYSPPLTATEAVLQKEPDLNWSRETNDIIEGYDWLSIWFEGTEAKLKSDTVLDIVATELQQQNQKRILGKA
jgi:hypothetical protein